MRVRRERPSADPDSGLASSIKRARGAIAICVSLATDDTTLAANVHRLLTQRNRGKNTCKVNLRISAGKEGDSRVELITDPRGLLRDSRRLQHATRIAVKELELRMTA